MGLGKGDCSVTRKVPEALSRVQFGGSLGGATGELDAAGATIAARDGHRFNDLAPYASGSWYNAPGVAYPRD